MCLDKCVEKMKKENLIKLSFFLNVLHIYASTVKIYWLWVPWHNTEKVILIKL